MGISKKTDNSFLDEKVILRARHLPKLQNTVLECFAGEGHIWEAVQKKCSDKTFQIVKIDKVPRYPGTLKGDNLKYLRTLDLSVFDVVDLDAYGIPFAQCETLFQRQYHGVVHVTVIQSGIGMLPLQMLNVIGFLPVMVKKCPTLFCSHGIEKFLEYLAVRGVTYIEYFRFDRKFYGVFKL